MLGRLGYRTDILAAFICNRISLIDITIAHVDYVLTNSFFLVSRNFAVFGVQLRPWGWPIWQLLVSLIIVLRIVVAIWRLLRLMHGDWMFNLASFAWDLLDDLRLFGLFIPHLIRCLDFNLVFSAMLIPWRLCWLIKVNVFTSSSCIAIAVGVVTRVLVGCMSVAVGSSRVYSLAFSFLGRDGFAFAGWFLRRGVSSRMLVVMLGLMLLVASNCIQVLLISCILRRAILVVIWVLVGSTSFLLVSPHRSKSKTFATFLVVCRRLRNLLLQRQIRVVIVLDACRGGCAWLYYNWVDVLDVWNLDLLSIFARWAPSPHGLRWIRAITATAAAHKGRIVSKLETFVRFSRANRSFMVRTYLSSGESLLELRGPIQSWATALNLLLGLSSRHSLFWWLLLWRLWVSHLRSSRLLSSVTGVVSVLNT